MTLIMECYKSIMASSVLSGLDVDFGRKTRPPKYCYPGFWKICACFLNGVNCIEQPGILSGGHIR